ncbi:hypothetical protein KBK19_10145 [Microvirga sp. STR05]|uniref:hypothetical protein n=1 Tax=Hymenobacter duratus TaxID=2771356 RepID=UPI001B8D5DAD|nr:hypothetical protein [Hymenobacter duratus]MBR7950303.1 hypothetical protein [Microvirga sp. STR05]
MKKLFTHLFAFGVNFYFLSACLGLAAAVYTTEQGPLHPVAAVCIPVASLLLCICYQLRRRSFSFLSPGEIALSNHDKSNLLLQQSGFALTRIPLFILLLLTLALPSNFLDGLSEEQTYRIPQVATLALLYFCFYRGLVFFSQPRFSTAAMFVGGLLLSAVMSYTPGAAGAAVSALFLALAGLWIVAWLLYQRFHTPLPDTP